jgi:hypothetical protein
MDFKINHCSDLECSANKKGICQIENYVLINPKEAYGELKALNN